MTIGIFGGGFFYAPFTQTATYGPITLTNGALPGVPGAWVQIVAASPQGRWLQLDIANPSAANSYAIQLGRGAAGLEAFWQPSGPIGGFWAQMAIATVHPPRVYSFPISLELNTRLVARSAGAIGQTIDVFINIWG